VAVAMAQEGHSKSQLGIGVVVVNGSNDTVIIKAHDQRSSTRGLLRHAAMVSIEMVAEIQRSNHPLSYDSFDGTSLLVYISNLNFFSPY